MEFSMSQLLAAVVVLHVAGFLGHCSIATYLRERKRSKRLNKFYTKKKRGLR